MIRKIRPVAVVQTRIWYRWFSWEHSPQGRTCRLSWEGSRGDPQVWFSPYQQADPLHYARSEKWRECDFKMLHVQFHILPISCLVPQTIPALGECWEWHTYQQTSVILESSCRPILSTHWDSIVGSPLHPSTKISLQPWEENIHTRSRCTIYLSV